MHVRCGVSHCLLPPPAKRPLLPHDSSPKAAPKKAAKTTEKAPAGQMSAADLLKMYNFEPLPSSNDPQIVEVDSASEISEESDQMKEPADNAAGRICRRTGLAVLGQLKALHGKIQRGQESLRQDV